MYILITGGAGFIGSNFIKYMLDKYYDYNIINLDLLTYAGNLDNLKEIEKKHNHIFVEGDIADSKLVRELFDKYPFKYVINFAAESHVDRSIEDPEVFVRTNILGTQVLLDAAKSSWMNSQGIWKEGVKYIQVSTDEVYGSLGNMGKFTEESPIAPNSPYSASKASADMIVRAYYKTFGMPINITRCSNNYGPNQYPEKLIPLMIKNTLALKDLPVYGDGLQIRDWLYVQDHCSAIDVVLHKGKIGEVYNIGGNNEKTNIEMVRLIIKTIRNIFQSRTDFKSFNPNLFNESLIKYVTDRPGHDRRYAIDNTKITTSLEWMPKFTFKKGIKNTIIWYIQNSELFDNTK